VTALVGRFVPRIAFLYDYAWFVGFFVAGGVYYLLMLGLRSRLERPLHQERKAVA
jgi:NCS1 family nucleobase:cation symporter-1